MVEKQAKKRHAIRPGRPPRKHAGKVDERILDAAQYAILKHGLAGASIDEIAALARAGKPSIYARFPGKEALFAAVVSRNVAAAIERLESSAPSGSTLDERLAGLGTTAQSWILSGQTIDLMRASISEARRLPDLANNVKQMAQQRCQDAVSHVLSEAAQSAPDGALPAFAPKRVATTARYFVDFVIMPMVMRALHGENLESLRADIKSDVAARVPFFLAACRHGGVA
jgi:AcrR family transcriptional regulator